MKKYYYKNTTNNTVYSNDPNVPDATKVKLIYNCAEVVNREGKEGRDIFASGTAPWYCIKDGDVQFYADFNYDQTTNKVTSIGDTKFNRRIFTLTQDCITDAWWISGSNWEARRKIPFIEKKELYVGKEPVINVLDRFDEDGNIIGNKISWKMSQKNMEYYPTIGGPYPDLYYYIERIDAVGHISYYKGRPYTYDSQLWTSNYDEKTVFHSESDAEDLKRNIPQTSGVTYLVQNYGISQDDATSACIFKSQYFTYTTSGFSGYSDKTGNWMFQPNNWCSVVNPPTAIENTEFGFTPKNNSIGASPSYFNLDISQVPTKYTKLDVVIDGVFYYPYDDNIGPNDNPIPDIDNIHNTYNFGESPIDETYNCWAYLFKPDNNDTWMYAPKYILTAKKMTGEATVDIFYTAAMDSTYNSNGWVYGTISSPPPNSVHASKIEVQNFLNQYSTQIAEDTVPSTVDVYEGIIDNFIPLVDYLGNGFFGNISANNSLAQNSKTPFYNINTTYDVHYNTFYDNSYVRYSLTDKKVYDRMYVYCVNTNNDDILKFSANIDGNIITGYALWDDIATVANCDNIRTTAYTANNTNRSVTGSITAYTCPQEPFNDVIKDYRDYFDLTRGESAYYYLSANTKPWQDISSCFEVYGSTNSVLDSTTKYLYVNYRQSENVSSYSNLVDVIPKEPICRIKDYYRDKGYWNEYGYVLTSFQVFTLSNVTMRHQIDLGSRTSTGGFTFPDKPGDYRYLHVTYPATNTLRGSCKNNLITQIDMYYKFSE